MAAAVVAPALAAAVAVACPAVDAATCAAVCPAIPLHALAIMFPTPGRINIIATWPSTPILLMNLPNLLKALLIPLPIDLKALLMPLPIFEKKPIASP